MAGHDPRRRAELGVGAHAKTSDLNNSRNERLRWRSPCIGRKQGGPRRLDEGLSIQIGEVMVARLSLILLSALTGCAMPYTPQVPIVPKADTMIDAVAEFHDLRAAPKLVSGNEPYGVMGEDVHTPSPNQLTEQLSTALLEGLAASDTFRRLTVFDPKPDLILTGRVEQFYEHYRPKLWTYAPYSETVASLLRMNTYVSNGKVNLTLIVQKPTGKVVGRYTGQAQFDEDFRPNDDMSPGDRLNRALSEAVQEIQEKLIADSQLKQFRHGS
jgi:hypothetical protein